MRFSILAACALSLILTACEGGGAPSTAAERFVNNLPGSYSLAKDPTYRGSGWIVVDDGNQYWVINIDSYLRWDYVFDHDYFLDHAVPAWYVGNGYYEDWYGNLYEKDSGNSKDLLGVTARIEEKHAEVVGAKLSADYGLSLERGTEIGKLVGEWNKLKSSRSMTDADADKFSVPVLGFKLSDAMKAAKSGDADTIDSLIEKAADTNDTTPENIRDLIVKFVENK